jgi:hypothetical protein
LQEGKQDFFFEKKKQKTFDDLAAAFPDGAGPLIGDQAPATQR